jgi:hypothetical protein
MAPYILYEPDGTEERRCRLAPHRQYENTSMEECGQDGSLYTV